MKQESFRRIMEAWDEAFRLLGQPNFTSGIRYVYRELRKNVTKLSRARTKHGLEALLAREPEPSPDQLEAMVATIRLMPFQFRKATIEAAKTLPRAPGGRPRVLTPQDGKEICAQIGALLSQGVTLTDAVTRMAQRHDVGEITIRRVWQKRGKPDVEIEFPGLKQN